MRLSALTLLAALASAQSFHPAKREDVVALRRAVSEANEAHERVNELRAKMLKAKHRLDPDWARVRTLSAEFEARERDSDAAHVRAMQLAVDSFGLGPRRTTGLNGDREGPFGGIPMTWKIGYVDREFEHAVPEANGRYIWKPRYDPKYFFGVAFADGAIRITPTAFSSPAFLAAVILHENTHYEQYAAPDGPQGHRPDVEMRELFARQAVLARREALGLSAEEVRELDEDLSRRYRRLARASWTMALHFSLDADPAPQAAEDRRVALLAGDYAAQCGFSPTSAPRMEFTHPNASGVILFRFGDAAGARAAMLLGAACLDPGAETPCTDGLDSLEARWDDPRFKDSLLPGEKTAQDVSDCLWIVHARYRPGSGFQGVREAVAGYRVWKQDLADEAAAAARQERERKERAEVLKQVREREYREWQERERVQSERMRSQPQGEDRDWSDELQRWIVPAH